MSNITTSKRRAVLIVSLLCAIVLALRFLTWDWDSPPLPADIRFDAWSWQREAPGTTKPSKRSQMLSDLLSRYDVKGWSDSQVVQLLGEPYRRKEFGFDLVYFVGVDRGLGVDFEWLVFELDGDKVREAKVIVR